MRHIIANPARSAEGSATLADYAALLWRRKLTVLLALVGVPLVAVAISSFQAKEYTASTDVLLRTENLAAALSGVPDPSFGRDPQRVVDTQAKLARTPPVVNAALEQAGARISADEFLESSSVSADLSTDILSFSVRAPTPDEAITRANAYGRAYTTYRAELDLGPVRQALENVNARIAELRSEGSTELPLYSTLLERRQELESIRALQSGSAVVVDPAQNAPQTKPRLLYAGLLGTMVGLLLGVGLALVREVLENRPGSQDELQQQLGLHLLGRIPTSENGKATFVTLSHPDSVDAEAYRLLRMNFEHATSMVGGRVFVVTSSVAAEGKSTVAANLAVALARVGQSVILVDGDPLRPVLRERFNIRATAPGTHEVVTGRATLDSALAEFALPTVWADEPDVVGDIGSRPPGRSDEPGRLLPMTSRSPGSREGASHPRLNQASEATLRVLPSDSAPAELTDYLIATKWEALLAHLRREAAIVIVDAPPLTTSAGMGVARLAEGIVVVANVKLMRRPTLEQLSRMLDELAPPKVGLVLTGMSVDEAGAPGYGYIVPKGVDSKAEQRPRPTAVPHAEGRWSSTS